MPLDRFIRPIETCRFCPTMAPWRKFDFGCHGNLESKCMLISEAPGFDSINRGRYWTGKSGKLLRNELRSISEYTLEDIFYLTDVVKCRPHRLSDDTKNRPPHKREIESCMDFLVTEIDILKPSLAVAVGSPAWNMMKTICQIPASEYSSITDCHSEDGYRIIEVRGLSVIPILHPSNANRFMNMSKYRQHLREIFSIALDA